MLGVNAFFIPAKIITNYYTYSAMSSHLPLWFGQGAVFTIVLIVMAMQVPVRGMCCGYCKRGCSVGRLTCCKGGDTWTEMATFLRKYHGYYIAFGVTSDWYYHPMESSLGHLSGILNDQLFFWQMIVMYTPVHRNKYWCMACEFAVLLHGPLVALNRGGGAGMFGFGFTVVFLVTGQWGMPLHWATRLMFLVVFLAFLFMNYGLGWSKGFENEPVGLKDMHEITRIPMLYYMVMMLYFFWWLCVRWIRNIHNKLC